MKFLIDAQLPRSLARLLCAAGYDAIHTLDLPERNTTADVEVAAFADRDGRVVVSKDSDFMDTHILRGEPELLLLIATGNIPNSELAALFQAHLAQIVAAFSTAAFVELDRLGLTIHR